MKLASLIVAFAEAKKAWVEYSQCEANNVSISQTGLQRVQCFPNKKCKVHCKTWQGWQRVGAGNFRCRKSGADFFLFPNARKPECKTCASLEEIGLDTSQFDITYKYTRSGVGKITIRCKNGENVLPGNRNYEFAECVCNRWNRVCGYRQVGKNTSAEAAIKNFTCDAPKVEEDPNVQNDDNKSAEEERKRIPEDLVCSEQDRIVGGLDAIPNSWPWIVQLSYNYYGSKYIFQCSGTIINENTVLTAGHCCHNWASASRIRGTVGQHRIGLTDAGEFHIDFEEKFKHPEYRQGTLENDLCMLKTKGSIKLQLPSIAAVAAPACLPDLTEERPSIGTHCWAAGWGRVSFKGQTANILQEVNLPLISDAVCKTTDNERYFKPDSMFCAGWLEGERDACTGDSGGPLICAENGKPVLRGITSWGLGCAQANAPGVYTRVEAYVDWIQEHM